MTIAHLTREQSYAAFRIARLFIGADSGRPELGSVRLDFSPAVGELEIQAADGPTGLILRVGCEVVGKHTRLYCPKDALPNIAKPTKRLREEPADLDSDDLVVGLSFTDLYTLVAGKVADRDEFETRPFGIDSRYLARLHDASKLLGCWGWRCQPAFRDSSSGATRFDCESPSLLMTATVVVMPMRL